MYRYDEMQGAMPYDPSVDVDEWIVCSTGNPGWDGIGHSVHTDRRLAKLAQIKLYVKYGITAWIEHIPAFGPPGIEEQLDADIWRMKHEPDATRAPDCHLYPIIGMHNLRA